MFAFSNFEQTVNMPIWEQRPSTAHNTLCGQGGCYSNCHLNCHLKFSLDPKKIKRCRAIEGETCEACNHSFWGHHHYNVRWEQVLDTQVSVDQDMKKWEAAKEKTTALIEAGERALNELKQVVDHGTNDLAQLAEEYAALSLSGSFSAQVEKAVRLLEQREKGMEEKGLAKEQLEKMREGLGLMKKKLELLKIAADSKARSIVKKVFWY